MQKCENATITTNAATAANAKSRVKGFTFNTTSKKCTLYKSIRGERKNTSSVSGKKS